MVKSRLKTEYMLVTGALLSVFSGIDSLVLIYYAFFSFSI